MRHPKPMRSSCSAALDLRFALILLILLLLIPAPAAVQTPEASGAVDQWPAARAKVLLLGTFHFEGSAGDAYQPAFHVDVLSPERQSQVAEVASLLARFRPTKVAVEVGVARQATLDSLFWDHVEHDTPLRANEVFQLGFRVARMLGHERVYAIDAERHSFFLELPGFPERLEAAGDIDPEWQAAYSRLYREGDSLKVVHTLREHFLHMNSADRLRTGHGHYHIQWFKVEDEGDYFGADFTTGWYNRNLRIARNLQRITGSSGDRILVVIGSGHVPILRFVLDASPEYELVEVAEVLGTRWGER